MSDPNWHLLHWSCRPTPGRRDSYPELSATDATRLPARASHCPKLEIVIGQAGAVLCSRHGCPAWRSRSRSQFASTTCICKLGWLESRCSCRAGNSRRSGRGRRRVLLHSVGTWRLLAPPAGMRARGPCCAVGGDTSDASKAMLRFVFGSIIQCDPSAVRAESALRLPYHVSSTTRAVPAPDAGRTRDA
jgi:hypothetical protein